MRGETINLLNNITFLGVSLDNKLKFDQHIKLTCMKISKSIGILYKIQSFVPKSCLLTIYYSFIYPYLQYCIPVWGSTSDAHKKPLITLQKRAVRIICGASYREHTNPLFRANKILKIEDIYIFSIAIYMYKNNHNLTDLLRNHSYNTRFYNHLLPPYERLTTSQQSVIFNGARIWNDIPSSIRDANSMFAFKARLRKHLLLKYVD